MTPRKYEILVRKFYESPNNVTFSEIKKMLDLHGYWEDTDRLDGHDHYFINKYGDIIVVPIKPGTRNRVKKHYISTIRNILNLRENLDEMKKKLEKLNRYEEDSL